MKIKRLVLKNIRSYEDEEIIFPDGSLLLSGDVGSGKTTILLAIEYSLFGLQPGQRGSALLRNGADSGEVSLELEVDGQELLIERKLKRSNKSVSNEYASITIDGEKTESSITEIKTTILKILGYPSEFVKKNNLLYKYTVYTPQEQMKQIIIEDPQTRLNILRHIFGIEKYRIIRDNLAIFLTKLKEDSKILLGEIRDLDQNKLKLVSTKSLVELLKNKIEDKEAVFKERVSKRKVIESEAKELEISLKERDSLEKEVEKTNILLTSKTENLSSMRREYAEITKNISEVEVKFDKSELAKIKEDIILKKELIEKANRKYIEIASKINFLELKEKENLGKKDRVFSIHFCPTCLQNVPDSHKYNIMNEVEKNLVDIKKENTQIRADREELQKFLETEKLSLEKLEQNKINLEVINSRLGLIEKSKQKAEEIKKSIFSLEKDMTLLLKHSDDLKADIFKMSKFVNLNKLKQEQLKQSFREEKEAEISKAEFKKELELTLKEIDSINNYIQEKEITKDKYNKISDMVNWLSTQFQGLLDFTERNIMIKLRIEFSKLFNKWFTVLVPEGSFEVQLDDNFTPLIIQGETEMEYSFLSGGERTAVALAYRLALNQTINSLFSEIKTKDLVILDEPTEGFSDFQLDRIRDVLEELNINQLIMVSHEQKMEGFVDKVIRLKKHMNLSSVEARQ